MYIDLRWFTFVHILYWCWCTIVPPWQPPSPPRTTHWEFLTTQCLGLWWVAGAGLYWLLSIRSDITPDMTTLLRLPHMDIVLAPVDQGNPRRSDRIRNLSQTSSQENSEGQPRRGKRRRRYNSVMEEDIDDTEDLESKRREPEHRRLNRLRLMKQNENVSFYQIQYWPAKLTNNVVTGVSRHISRGQPGLLGVFE